VSGTGDGTLTYGEQTTITADTHPDPNYSFDAWTGDTSGCANVNASPTTYTMPASNAAVTATYTTGGSTYTLTVASGTGDGSYSEGEKVSISADAAPTGQIFDEWTGDVNKVLNPYMPNTVYTMPAAAATVTATYSTYTAVTASGTISSSGYYRVTQDISAAGSCITIDANDVVLDLGGYRLTYDTTTQGSYVNGGMVTAGKQGVTIRNGEIVEGAGATALSHAVRPRTTDTSNPLEICYLAIYVQAEDAAGVRVNEFSNSSAHHIYVHSDADIDTLFSEHLAGLEIHATYGGCSIYDNIIVGSHAGIVCGSIGYTQENPNTTYIYNTLIQHER
ncbi:hypothetical protein LCGC14_3167980, partial [marine sediment metagenome]